MRDIWYLVLPLIISALITPVVKQIGYRLDAFAQMNERTVHHGKIVRIGGVAIYLAFIITMALYVKTDMAMNGILIGSTIMFIGGLVDDLVNLKPLYKFSFQVVAAIVLIASGVTLDVIRLPLGITINMGVVSFIVTFFWITGITNAVNLIDGLDGLCGGISVIILTVIAMLAVIEGRGDVEMIALILSLLIHIIGGKVLPILFMMFYSFGAIFLLLSAAGTYFEIDCSKYLPYYLSGALPLTAESGPYLQLFGIIGLLTILAFCADLLVLRKKDL